jgi:hypothetical protein
MTAFGELVLVAVGRAGLEVLNAADPDRPTRFARILGPPDKGAFAVAFLAGYAYVGQRGQLTVVDLADPGAPRVSARVSRCGSSVMALAVVGGVVAVSDWDRDNQNIDLYDRVSLVWRGRMAVHGKLRYMVPLGMVDRWHPVGPELWWRGVAGGFTDPRRPGWWSGADQRCADRHALRHRRPGGGEGRAYVADPRAGLLVLT